MDIKGHNTTPNTFKINTKTHHLKSPRLYRYSTCTNSAERKKNYIIIQ